MACDALSRYPWSEKPVIPSDVNSVVVATLDPQIMVAGWEDVREATVQDAELQNVSSWCWRVHPVKRTSGTRLSHTSIVTRS